MAISGTYGSIEIERGKVVVKSACGDGEGWSVPVLVEIPIDDLVELLRKHRYEVKTR